MLRDRVRSSYFTLMLAIAAQAASMEESVFIEGNKITPGDYKSFVIDYDIPASERYQEIYEYFEDELASMIDYWWNTFYQQEIRDWFSQNIDQLARTQPDAYEANKALADFLGLDVAQTFGVSSITEISTYCTSIVSQTAEGEIAHVRNLDFKDTEVMKKLVHEQVHVKDGVVKARSPLIAGFYGAFTGQVANGYSISYNVRERVAGATHEQIMSNLNNNLDESRTNQANAILYSLLNIDTYEDSVNYFKQLKMTSPSHFIIGGLTGNEGIVISRTEDEVSHLFELSDQDWFVAMTNVDVWQMSDSRFENATRLMHELGKENVHANGESIIENVLWDPNVIQADSIFTAAISAKKGFEEQIYDSPSQFAATVYEPFALQ